MKALKIGFISLSTLVLLVACKSAGLNEVVFLDHQLEMTLNVDNHSVTITDKGKIKVNRGANIFYLAPDAQISKMSIQGKPVRFTPVDTTVSPRLRMRLASHDSSLALPDNALWVLFKQQKSQNVQFTLEYTAVFNDDVSGTKFSNQNVGREVAGTILDQGAYLSPGAYYYPRGNDGLMAFEVTATIPRHWESIADGNSIASVTSETTRIQSWKNPYQAEGLMFMAAPFVVKQTRVNNTDVYCYFFQEDTSLFSTYLPATAGYVNMYSDMIGPYPFKRFTVVENFFPTGYGMPAWTLLGQQVIRLPFIVLSSLGHEVLHNWWGNSIYVDYENGNWCEGLTVYGADYHYKLMRSAASARDYRKDILKAYQNYVTPANEFPVREFIARHNAESRTIGYNKTMMIFHMIEDRIGTDNFFQAWRNIFAAHKGEQVTWEQWLAAYEQTSGQDLSDIIPQWVDRTGAAKIEVELLESDQANGQTHVKFKVTQPDQEYNLRIPVKFIGIDVPVNVVTLSGAEAVFEFTVPGLATGFELDPDYDLFRHLYPEEIEPTIAAVLGATRQQFVYSTVADTAAFQLLANNIAETNVTLASAATACNFNDKCGVITLNPAVLPPGLAQQIELNENNVKIKGKTYPRVGHTFVLSADGDIPAVKQLIIITSDPGSLPRLGQLIPHYGKYSYLVFQGSHNIAKGQWPSLASPLRILL